MICQRRDREGGEDTSWSAAKLRTKPGHWVWMRGEDVQLACFHIQSGQWDSRECLLYMMASIRKRGGGERLEEQICMMDWRSEQRGKGDRAGTETLGFQTEEIYLKLFNDMLTMTRCGI